MPVNQHDVFIQRLIKIHGLWGCHPIHTQATWKHTPSPGTQLDYWRWVAKQLKKEERLCKPSMTLNIIPPRTVPST